MTKQKVIIIGAGIGGIATANILAKAGYEVAVYEKNSQPGGRAGLLEKDGFRFDTGPSWYLMPDVFKQYFALFEKDVDKELDLSRLSPAYKTFFEDKTSLTITSDLDKDARTFEEVEPGAGEHLRAYVEKGEEMYRLSLKHFLYSNFASLRDLTHYDIMSRATSMAKMAFTPIDRYVRAHVSNRHLQQILEYPMVFLGASPFSAPALYSLMSALDFKEGVFYPQGGLYTIIDRLIDISNELGVVYHYDSEIIEITTEEKRATGIRTKSGKVISADIVVSNADLHFTETQLLAEHVRTYPSAYWQKKQAGPSALLCYLGVKGELPTLEHHNLLFVDAWKENFDSIYKTKDIPTPASLYICKPSASDPTVAPDGHENVFVLVPLPADVPIHTDELNKLADSYLQQIADTTGIHDFQERIVSKTVFGPNNFETKFHAWQSTALGPSHLLSQSAFFRTKNKSKKLANLYYTGGFTTPGVGLPMCLISAQLVYKRLANDRAGGPIETIKDIGGYDA